MPRTNAIIPVSKGIDQRLDERLRSADSLGVLTNAIYRRNDAVQKRNGFTRVGGTIKSFDPSQTEGATLATQGEPRGIFSTDLELCVRGYRSLYAYDGANWYNKGAVSPFIGTQRPVFSSARNYSSTDCASNGSEVVHVGTSQQTNASGSYYTEFVFKTETADGIEQTPTTVVASVDNTTNAEYTAAKIIYNGVQYVASVQRDIDPGNNSLTFYEIANGAVGATIVTHNDVKQSTSGDFGDYYRHDSCDIGGLPAGNWAYAYVREGAMGATSIYVAVYNQTSLLYSTTIPEIGAPWENVSICWGSTTNQIYVVAGTHANSLQAPVAFAFTFPLVPVWGPSSLPNGGFSTACLGSGCVEATVDGTTYLWVGLNESDTSASYDVRKMFAARLTTNAGSVYSMSPLFNTYGYSKPFVRSNRVYIAARCRYDVSATGILGSTYSNDDGYSGEVVLDLLDLAPYTIPGSPEFFPHVVGRYNFGVTQSVEQSGNAYDPSLIRGSFANVTVGSDATVSRYATQRISFKSPQKRPLLCGDVVELDFDGKVTAEATTRGSATVGGGSVQWYSGQRSEELGFASGPVLARATTSGSGGALSAGTYTYVGVFESYDERGNLVRSLPGPPAQVNVPHAGSTSSVTLTYYSLGPTCRYINGKPFKAAVYRAGADGVFKRCTFPTLNITSTDQSATFGFVDRGDEFDILYTQSGAELEAAGPDGAAYVATTSQRVWLAGFFRRDRVQYSKLYNPATANEYALAPEFNDAFAYLIPGGAAVTGIEEMDDKVVVFTRNSIYAIAGNGPDDGGRNNDFSGLQLINSDTGCVDARSIVSFPGGIMFQAASGLFVLGRDFQLAFLGAQVRDITDEYTEVTSACLVPAANHVRFTLRKPDTTSIVLCYDLDQGAWIRWEPRKKVGLNIVSTNIVGACLHNGTYYLLDADGSVFKEDASTHKDDGTIFVPMTIETSWLQAAQQSGWQRVRTVAALCKSLNPHNLQISLYQDFSLSPSQFYIWTESEIASQKLNELVEMRSQVQKCTAFKIQIFDFASAGTTTGQGYECAGFAVELGGKRGLYKPGTQQRN